MTWLRLDDDWYQRPAIVALSADAFRLHVAGMSHTMRHLTDRVVTSQVVSMLAPGYRVKVLEELLSARLWLPFPDGSGWWIADPVMELQPTHDEWTAEREGEAARQELGRARNPRKNGRPQPVDPEAVRRAEARVEAARNAKVAAADERRRIGGRPPWEVPPVVTRDTPRDVTSSGTVTNSSPDPTRPGEPPVLSGSEGVEDSSDVTEPIPFRQRGFLPPPGHPGPNGSRRRPSDDEMLDDCRRVLSDPKSPPWLVADAEGKLVGLGMTREQLLAPAGVES